MMAWTEQFVVRVEHDPTGTYQRGAIIPYGEFLMSARDGSFPIGMKVTKCAAQHSFKVSESVRGTPCLRDENEDVWHILENKSNWCGYQLRKYVNRRKAKRRK